MDERTLQLLERLVIAFEGIHEELKGMNMIEIGRNSREAAKREKIREMREESLKARARASRYDDDDDFHV